MNYKERLSIINKAFDEYSNAVDAHFKEALKDICSQILVMDKERTESVYIRSNYESDDEGGTYLSSYCVFDCHDGIDDYDDYEPYKCGQIEDKNLKALVKDLENEVSDSELMERAFGGEFNCQYTLNENGELEVSLL